MKIKFSETSLDTPDTYKGQKLEYGSPKRVFPKAKWYMILFFVLTPVVLLLLSMVWSAIQVAGEGVLESKVSTFTASEDGRVEYIEPFSDSLYDSGSTLIILNNHSGFEVDSTHLSGELTSMKHSIAISKDIVEVRRKEYQNTQRLYKKGVVSLPDLLVSQGAYLDAQYQTSESEVRFFDYQRSEGLRLQNRLNTRFRKYQLGSKGKIIASYAKKASFVQKDSPLMVVQHYPVVYYYTMYLKPKYQKYVYLGQELRIRHASGTRVKAVVTKVEKIIQTPEQDPNLTLALLANKRRLQVRLEAVDSIPSTEQIIGSPVTTNFPFWHRVKRTVARD